MTASTQVQSSAWVHRWGWTLLHSLGAMAVVGLLVALMVNLLESEAEATPATARREETVAAEYASKIKSVLPAGWSIIRDKNLVTIRREKPVEWYGTISLPMHKDKADLKARGFVHFSPYTITLEFFAPMTEVAVARLEEENRKTEAEYDRQHPQPVLGKPLGPPKELTDRLHHIPNVFSADCSVLMTPWITGWLAFYDQKDAVECRGIERSVHRILSGRKAQPGDHGKVEGDLR